MTIQGQSNPDGTYLRPKPIDVIGFPDDADLPYFPNDVQHATRWNLVIDALNALRRVIGVLTGTVAATAAQVAFSYDLLDIAIPVQVLGAAMDMVFAGRITDAVLVVTGPTLAPTGTGQFEILKNGVGTGIILAVAAEHRISASDLAIDFAVDDELQVECLANTDIVAFVISLKVTRL